MYFIKNSLFLIIIFLINIHRIFVTSSIRKKSGIVPKKVILRIIELIDMIALLKKKRHMRRFEKSLNYAIHSFITTDGDKFAKSLKPLLCRRYS